MGTALVALVAGSLGAGLTGLLQLRRDRVETLRQRQLDAADAFAASTARALLSVKLLIDAQPRDRTDDALRRWREAGHALRESLWDDVREVAGHGPRVELLFGIKTPASVAAMQTVYDLTLMATHLQPPLNEEAFAWAYKLAIEAAMRFHDEAHVVVATSWWGRRRHRSIPDQAYNEMMKNFEGKYGLTNSTY
jgi:hypothetical protein